MTGGTCAVCGAPFDKTNGNQKTCSPACSRELERSYMAAYWPRYHARHRDAINAIRRARYKARKEARA